MATPFSGQCSTPEGEQQSQDGIEPVRISDADHLARAVECPASESTPLFRVMFPCLGADFSFEQKDEIVRWHAQGITDSINDGKTCLRKIRYGDGTVAGLVGWVVERNKTATKIATKAGSEQSPEKWVPKTLDVRSWLDLSAALRRERERVIRHLDNVCRITIVSICPEYQRQGLGSKLMQHVCEDIDGHNRYGFTLGSPAGVRLYSRFGFEPVGRVETPYGPITSMLRRPKTVQGCGGEQAKELADQPYSPVE